MKYFLLILFSFLLLNNEIVGEYNIISNSKGDKLIIKNDDKFIYEKRGNSCWLWKDIVGNWEVKNDILFLFEVRNLYELDEKEEKVIKEWEKIIQHKFKIIDNGIKALETDLSNNNTHYKKNK